MFKKRKKDVLQKKREELALYNAAFEDSVSVVTKTVETLSLINEGINEKIKEIDEYQEGLTQTRNDLDDAKAKNERVIKNFNALLSVD